MTDAALPVAADDLSNVTKEWMLWPGWDNRDPALVRRLDDRRWVAVIHMLYTWAIICGRHGVTLTHDDRWCYHDPATAVAAAWEWDGTGEPEGWHRHPGSGRRRPDGDATREYVTD